MKRHLFIGLAVIGLVLGLGAPALAQLTTGNATTYVVSVTSIELCSSAACSSPAVVGSGAKDFDIASAAVGGAIGAYASTGGLPKGRTFTHIRATMSRTIRVSGNAGSPPGVTGDCITDGTAGSATAGATITPGQAAAASNLVVPDVLSIGGVAPTAAEYAAQGLTLVDAASMRFVAALASPVTIGETPPSIDIAFQTRNAVGAANNGANLCLVFPQPPVSSITFN